MSFSYIQTFPGGGTAYNPNTLRVNIRAVEITKQNLRPKNIDNIETGDELYSWSMIAPTDIQEAISHTYEEYSSIQGRLVQLFGDTAASTTKIVDVKNGFTNGTTDAAKYKVDSPLVYTGSQRRQYSFTFPMMEHHTTMGDVMSPIDAFRKYSCATIDNASYETIGFPAVFEIESWPVSFIHIPFAVLTDVQVTYNAPYKYGYPMRAEMTLTFKDIKPLYRSSWGDLSDKITTSTSNDNTESQKSIRCTYKESDHKGGGGR